MTRASEPNSPVDYWRSMGRILHPALLVLFALALLCLSAGGFLVYALEHDPIGLAIGIPSLLLTVPAYSVALVAHIRSGPGTD